jgi:cell shape-determining protein MreD
VHSQCLVLFAYIQEYVLCAAWIERHDHLSTLKGAKVRTHPASLLRLTYISYLLQNKHNCLLLLRWELCRIRLRSKMCLSKYVIVVEQAFIIKLGIVYSVYNNSNVINNNNIALQAVILTRLLILLHIVCYEQYYICASQPQYVQRQSRNTKFENKH